MELKLWNHNINTIMTYNTQFCNVTCKEVPIKIENNHGYIEGGVNGRVSYINYIHVAKTHRNNGIGTRLILDFLLKAIGCGAVRVELDDCTYYYNQPTNNIYMKLGFKYKSPNDNTMYGNIRSIMYAI